MVGLNASPLLVGLFPGSFQTVSGSPDPAALADVLATLDRARSDLDGVRPTLVDRGLLVDELGVTIELARFAAETLAGSAGAPRPPGRGPRTPPRLAHRPVPRRLAHHQPTRRPRPQRPALERTRSGLAEDANDGLITSSTDFLVGASTAAHQIEGNNVNSDWWVIEHAAGTSIAGAAAATLPTATTAGAEDIDLRRRRSASTPTASASSGPASSRRPGTFSRAELAHYRRMIDGRRSSAGSSPS